MKKFIFAFFVSLFFIGIFSFNSCARMGNPTGGDKDTIPPVLLWAKPDTMALNVNPLIKEIELHFDEYVQVKDYNKNVVISPPLAKNPIVFPQSLAEKTVRIKLQAPLDVETTYSFNFGDAIQDYNEGNKLSNFTYVISTGNYIDSLRIKGNVYSGFDFELPKKTLVGLYKIDEEYTDSLILKNKPYYVSRVNENGEFDLKFLRNGKYKIIAFEDVIENTMYDPIKEKIAFRSEVIDLNEPIENISLKLFSEKPKYRVTNSEMKGLGHLVFRTEGADEEIIITPISREFSTAFIDAHPTKDSVNFWFNQEVDKIENKTERLRFTIQHKDSIDTVTVLYKVPVIDKDKDKGYEAIFKRVKDGKLPPDKSFKIVGSAPIKTINKSLINVFKDTIEIPFEVSIDEVNKQVLNFDFKKDLNESFEINVFPNAIIDLFDAPNDTLVYQFKTGAREEYGNLKVKIENIAKDIPVFLQLIKKGQNFDIVEEQKGLERLFTFNNLIPGDYYLRLLVDENKNGIWDSGNLLKQLQPEPVYIYPSKITIRALWDTEETWIIGNDSDKFLLQKEEVTEIKNQGNTRTMR